MISQLILLTWLFCFVLFCFFALIYFIIRFIDTFMTKKCPIGKSCRICWLHLCRGVNLTIPKNVLIYDTKPSDGEGSVLQFWGMWSIPSLQLLQGPLCSGVVVHVRILSMGEIELFSHLRYLKPLNCIQAID